jgi:Holliday junction resolvasome RuvABC ATP-dependent DNA helicase subunit
MIEFSYKLLKDIEEYCSVNNINDISKYANQLLKKAFMEEKYGKKPDIFVKQEKENDSIKPTTPIETNIKEEKVNFVEEVHKLSGEEVAKELNPRILETLNIKEKTKQETEEIEKPKKSKKRKLS